MTEATVFLGQVQVYKRSKQFGFIKRLSDQKEFFVHGSVIKSEPQGQNGFLYPGEYVEFTVESEEPPEGKKLPNVTTVSGLMGCELLYEFRKRRFSKRSPVASGDTTVEEPNVSSENLDSQEVPET